mmetsp:Transcript_41752/g.77239  ORF Transcript_41752/g.77239 Transcript_41752/m.77239 type:complete len:657 (-) Transcript_41752:751-2721(-)|eukprot:CAMPEP_0197434402 /NCGR_PEP_ID=MMETSP1175-20131217/2145_1 /TAXON_ID=1003142 /ORGANISM="Triceratium dubium, Strain CCMP147" /LENGTH=656 /DNA_ID=CAMNT_0042963113 /DNA_START=68 /DNA_END=2038 /DNA_ORIENTATION=-
MAPARRRPAARNAMASPLLVLLLGTVAHRAPTVDAGWIDPDTPEEAYTTWSLPAHAYHRPTSANCTNSTHGGHGKNCTNTTKFSPSSEPLTDSPTMAPTEQYVPREYKLVMSDEFNTPGRTFEDGSDPKWTSIHKNDYTNDAQHFYSRENAYTDGNGDLVIKTEAKDTEFIGFDDVHGKEVHATKHFRSAMVQSWNKFCFTGGVIEAEVELPGKANVGGLWPAFWLLGNLARHTYVASSAHVWPWSDSECNSKSMDAQLISGCSKALHWDMEPSVGRGSPEIDIFEVQPGPIKAGEGQLKYTYVGQPFMSASYQVAPGVPFNRPGPGTWPGPGQWYEGLIGGNESALNIVFYGSYNSIEGGTSNKNADYWADAISYNRQLHKEHFQRKHKYRVEWEVPDKENGNDGYLQWFLNDQLVLKINGTSLTDMGLGSEISSEPSYIIMNTAVSSQWGFPKCPTNCPCKKYNCHTTDYRQKCGLPTGFCDMMNETALYKVNYVRVYQDPNDPKQKVGCSTPERPTRKWIEGHEADYKQEGDAVPLKSIKTGGGSCSTSSQCGGSERGVCSDSSSVCECREGWTGPRCLSHAGYDDVKWDEPDSLSDVGFHPPTYFPAALVVGFAICVVMLVVGVIVKTRSAKKGYVPVPSVPSKINGHGHFA